jgi:NADPH:quinone reductase-like Zn-dependent oxidoreductase
VVIAITSPAKSHQIRRLGAEFTLARDAKLSKALGKHSIDVVIDLVAGKQWPELLNVLKPLGRYATSGAIARPFVEMDVRTLYLKDLTLFGCTVLNQEVFPNLIERIEAGELSALVAETFSLREIAEAQKQFETKQHVGELVNDVSREG